MNKPTDQEDDIHYYSSAEIQFAFENQARNHIFQKDEEGFCNKIQFIRVNFNPLINSNIFNKYYVYDVLN